MSLLNFIKNRPQEQAVAKQTKESPRLEAPKLAAQKPEAQRDVAKALSAADLAKVREVGERLQRATAHYSGQAKQPEAGGSTNSALLQKQNNQDKTQSAMSPTDNFKGQTALQGPSQGMSRGQSRGISR